MKSLSFFFNQFAPFIEEEKVCHSLKKRRRIRRSAVAAEYYWVTFGASEVARDAANDLRYGIVRADLGLE